MTVSEIQKEPLVTDDLTPYEGSWVAIRDGRVIAQALGSTELLANPAVESTDALMPVPVSGAAALFL